MATLQVQAPYAFFHDSKGKPLDYGYVYIGTKNLDPETAANRIQVWWDEGLSDEAEQPIRTLNGFYDNNGKPGKIYTNQESYSITVRNKNLNLQYFTRDINVNPFDATVNTYADLTASVTTDKKSVNVLGGSSVNDGNGGVFIWDQASTETEDNIDIFESDDGGVGRWIRVFDYNRRYVNTISNLVAFSSIIRAKVDYVNVGGFYAAGDGGGGEYYWSTTTNKSLHDGGYIIDPDIGETPGTTAWYTATGITTGCWVLKNKYDVSVLTFGAKPDASTDCLDAFTAAASQAYTYGNPVYIPAADIESGLYYDISDTWTLTNLDNIVVHGDGVSSMIVITATDGSNAITVDSTINWTIKNIGISGILGSGHGIEMVNASHFGNVEDVWVGWVDGDCIRQTSAIDMRYTRLKIIMNNGYDPAGLGAGVRGNSNNGLYIPYNASGLNNDARCIACTINGTNPGGVNGYYGLKVGDSSGRVDSFSFTDGLVQASGTHQEIYLKTRDALIGSTHIEPPSGVSANYIVILEDCLNTVLDNCFIQGDVSITGTSTRCGITNFSIAGVYIGPNTEYCFLRDGSSRNLTNGPIGGYIQNLGSETEIIKVKDSSQSLFAIGKMAKDIRMPYVDTNFESWSTATTPSGFAAAGGTIAQETTIVKYGPKSAKITYSADLSQGIQVYVYDQAGKWVDFDIWNYSTNLIGYVTITVTGGTSAGTYSFRTTYSNDMWENSQFAFFVPADSTAITAKFTSTNGGVIYWDSVKIYPDGYNQKTIYNLDGTATPAISYKNGVGGYPIPLLKTFNSGSPPTITNFLDGWQGKQFTLLFTDATVITDGANIKLNGTGNFTGKAGDTLTLVMSDDYIFYEVARSVN